MAVFAGQTIKASLLDRLERPPTAELIQTVGQSVPNGTWGIITFDSEVEDSHGGHSTVTNTSRYTCMVSTASTASSPAPVSWPTPPAPGAHACT